MGTLSLSYPHDRDHLPLYISHKQVEEVAARAREQLQLGERVLITVDDLKAIDRLCVNGIDFEVWHDTEHEVHDDQGNEVLGVFEYIPQSALDAVNVCVSPIKVSDAPSLMLSTFAHELGHAVFDGPALVKRHLTEPLFNTNLADVFRQYRSMTESHEHLRAAISSLPAADRFAELRANEFMGALLVPRKLLWDAVLELAPRMALKTVREDTLFAESLDGVTKILWSETTYEMDLWSLTRALAPRFGVSPAFIEVRMMRYGISKQMKN